MKNQVHWKRLSIFLGGMILLGGGIHFLHGHQMRRNAPALLQQADRCETEKNLEDAAFFLHLYLQRVPSDTDARARYVVMQTKLARTPKDLRGAYNGLEDFLRSHPDQQEVRREAVRLAMSADLKAFRDARFHLEHLLKENANDGELELLMGRCWLAEKRYQEASNWLGRATEHIPREATAYALRAHVLRQYLANPDEATKVINTMVTRVDTAEAYLTRARFHQVAGKAEDASKDVRQAYKKDADNAEAILAFAQLSRDEKKMAEARDVLRHGLEGHPRDARLYLLLAQVQRKEKPAEAITCLRKGLDVLHDEPALLWDLALLLIENKQAHEVSDLIVRLRKTAMPEPRLDYLAASILFVRGEWAKAAHEFERIRPLLQPWADLTHQTDLRLGRCFVQLGDAEQQYAAFQRAAKADPTGVGACLGLGGALERLGRRDDAINIYRRIVSRAPQACLAVARLLIARNLALPPTDQRWRDVEDELIQAEKALPDEVAVLRAQVLLAQGKGKKAYDLLAQAREKPDGGVDLWVAEAALAEEQGQAERVLPLLDKAEAKFGDRVELRLARASYGSRRGEPGRKVLLRLAEDTGKLSRPERQRLWRGLAEIQVRLGHADEATQLLARLAAGWPNDLGARIGLFDLALMKEDPEAVRAAVEEIRKVEGDEGVFWRYGRACELVVRAKRGDKSGLAEARKLLALVGGRKPGWPRVALCEAETAALAGDRSLTIASYQRAVEQGERNPQVLRRLVELLNEERRYNEAQAVLRLVPEQSPIAEQLRRVAAEVSWQTGDYDRALTLAQKAVAADSKDYRDHVWLGQMLWAARKVDDAEAHLRQAVQLAGAEPAAWVALIQFLARTGKKSRATDEIKEAERRLTTVKAGLALAQCHEAVGDTEKARQLYEAVLAKRPKDVGVIRSFVSFRLRIGELKEAEPLLHTMIALKSPTPEDAAWARRMLALVLALQGDYQKSRRALEVLDLVEKDRVRGAERESTEELRARALVLATARARASRLKAIRVLEELADRQPLTPDDQFLLAQIHDSVGDWPRARDRMLSLVTSHGDNPLYLARYIQGLLRQKNADEAQVWQAKLEKLQPDTVQTIELKARVLHALGRGAEAAVVLQSLASREGARLLRVAGLLESLEQPKGAEEVYRQWVKGEKQPGASLVLAAFLGRQNRLREAITLCGQARKTAPPDAVAGASIAVLYASEFNETACSQVTGWIEEMVQREPRKGSLLNSLAAVRNLQGRYQEARELYLRSLAVGGDDPLALNNLAYLSALRDGQGAKALELLDRAEKVVGPIPNLLDTRAVVYLALGQGERARKLLEDLTADNPTAVGYFHLSQAYQMTRERIEALNTFQKARHRGLKPTDLHPLERGAYQKLTTDLGVK
jgi:tetratricopeptide (TPR) repeat protein